MFAAESGQADIARELIDRGASRSPLDREGQTALMIATKAGHKELAALLTASVRPRRKLP